MELKNIKRPSASLVKLVEATGILLGIPKSTAPKSKFKAPTPTNYDDTIEYLSTKFYAAMNFLVSQGDADFSNEVASELYSKTLEPGFNYEDAVRDGGLQSRELFNLVFLILMKLQSDVHRLPVRNINIIAVVDGSRSSYVALDIAAHMFSHGTCTVAGLTIGEPEASTTREHLLADITRRCKFQYKLPEHNVCLETVAAESIDDVVPLLNETIARRSCDVLVIGMSDPNIGLDSTARVQLWASWMCRLPVVLAKGSANFSNSNSRVFQICVKNLSSLKEVFLKSMAFLRPGDAVVVVSLLKSRGTRADCRETRYDGGLRCGWVIGPDPLVPDFTPEYYDEYAEQLQAEMMRYIEKAQVSGRVRIQYQRPMRTVAQELCQIAFEESSDIIVLKCSKSRELITECARDAFCSIAIIK